MTSKIYFEIFDRISLGGPKVTIVNPSELRLCVGKLDQTMTEEKLKSYFDQWGVVTDVHIRSKEWFPSNMAYITFSHYYKESPRMYRFHVIDGQRVTVNYVGVIGSDRHSRIDTSNSIMITGAIHRSSEAEIRETICKFGTILKLTRKRDPDNRQQFLRYAFIVFSDTKSGDKIIEASACIKVAGQAIDVCRSKNYD